MKYISGCCEGEICYQCKTPATHKVGEVLLFDDPNPIRHELTAYICCKCFQSLFGIYAKDYCKRNEHEI